MQPVRLAEIAAQQEGLASSSLYKGALLDSQTPALPMGQESTYALVRGNVLAIWQGCKCIEWPPLQPLIFSPTVTLAEQDNAEMKWFGRAASA